MVPIHCALELAPSGNDFVFYSGDVDKRREGGEAKFRRDVGGRVTEGTFYSLGDMSFFVSTLLVLVVTARQPLTRQRVVL